MEQSHKQQADFFFQTLLFKLWKVLESLSLEPFNNQSMTVLLCKAKENIVIWQYVMYDVWSHLQKSMYIYTHKYVNV